MKKITVSILAIILTLCVGFTVACKKDQTAYTLTLNKTSVTVEKYMNAFVIPEYNGTNALTWSSANSGVATVEDGRIYGVKEGSTTVSVTDGKVSASCSVTVTTPNPDNFAISFSEREFSLYVGRQKTLEPTVTYNNVPISGASFNFSTESTFVTVSSEGVVTANSKGVAIVTVKSTVDGKQLSADVVIDVQDVYSVEIQQANVVLYPFDSYAGKSYNKTIDCTASVYKEGQVISASASDITWSVDPNQDVIAVNASGKVTALNGGTAILTASYSADGKTVQGEIVITVAPVDVKVEGKVLDAGLNTAFKPDLNALVNVNEEISKAVVDAIGLDPVEILPENGTFDMSAFSSGDATIKLVTRNLSFVFDAVIYDGVISSVEDMKSLLSATSGKYKLVADIDMADYVDENAAAGADANVWISSMEFKGIIDGGGYAIKNFKTSTGLFKKFNGGTIRNIVFENVKTFGNIGLFGGYNREASEGILIDGIYVSFTEGTSDWYIGLLGEANLRETFTISNSVIVASERLTGKVSIIGRVGSYAINVKNCYLINSSVFIASLHNESKEALNNRHDPASNLYYACKTTHDLNRLCKTDGIKVEGVGKTAIEAYMSELVGHTETRQKDENAHWFLCSCGKEFAIESHVGEATCTQAASCTVCGQSYFGAHIYDQLKKGTDVHWYECVCGVAGIPEAHFGGTPTCDEQAKCEVCETPYGELHNYVLKYDEDCHWYECDGCEQINGEKEAHYGGNKTSTSGEKAICSVCKQPYGDPLPEYLEITEENFMELLSATSGIFHIVEDIDMAKVYTENNGVWASNVHFAGTIDGGGHTIKNLNTTTGLFRRFDGTLKKLVIVDAKVSGRVGVISSVIGTNSTIENCYIGVATQTTDYYAGTLTGQAAGITITITDSIIYNPSSCCAITGWCATNLRVNIDSDSIIIAKNTGFTRTTSCTMSDHAEHYVNKDYKHYTDAGMPILDYKQGKITGLESFVTAPLGDLADNLTGVKFIDSSNVEELLTVATTDVVYIIEDIDMATAYTENSGVWTSTVDFWGTIYGNGHTIKNFKTDTGLFKNYYGGTLKDLAFTNVSTVGDTTVLGGYANRNQGRVYNMDNLYVHVSSTTGSKVGLLGEANLCNLANLTNSMLVSDVANCGVFLKLASQPLKMTNVHLVNTVPYLASHYGANPTETQIAIMLPSTNTAYSYDSLSAMKTAYVSGTLSEMIETVSGLNA